MLAARGRADPALGASLDGHAAIALVHGYRARAGDEAGDEAAALAFETLERALAGCAELAGPWLFGGVAGIGFAVHHLADVVGDAGDVLAQLDAAIEGALAAEPWPHDFDLTGGAIGLGVYGLERARPALVARAVHHLAATAEAHGDGLAWRTFELGPPGGYLNLGLAHGAACVVGFLAGALAAGAPGAAALLRGAVAFLRGCERPDAVPCFPMAIGHAFPFALDGWCYGDPSTALALVRAGHAAGEPGWTAAGHALARRAAARTPAVRAAAAARADATLCHGAIGHALLFHRLGALLGDAALLDAARAWYREALAGADVAAIAAPGLQVGLAGVALGLLAGYAEVEPAWDRALLLS